MYDDQVYKYGTRIRREREINTEPNETKIRTVNVHTGRDVFLFHFTVVNVVQLRTRWVTEHLYVISHTRSRAMN